MIMSPCQTHVSFHGETKKNEYNLRMSVKSARVSLLEMANSCTRSVLSPKLLHKSFTRTFASWTIANRTFGGRTFYSHAFGSQTFSTRTFANICQ